MAMTAVAVPRRAVVFDLLLEVVAVVATAVAVREFLVSGEAFPWWLLLTIPVVGLISRFPLRLSGPAGKIEIGLDCAVLVFLAGQASGPAATLVWAICTVSVQMTVPKALSSRLFNTALCSLAGLVALQAMNAVDPMDASTPGELFAVAVGCAVYFTVDYVLTGVSLSLGSGTPLRQALWDSGVPLSLAAFLGVCSLGYVGTVLWRADPLALPLLAPPMLGILLAVRAFSRAHEDRARMRAMFEGARTLLAAGTEADILGATVEWASKVLICPGVTVAPASAPEPALSERLGHDGPLRWLVVPPRPSATVYDEDDVAALRAMAAVCSSALDRARLDLRMESLARHDPLTGLPNRAVFRERLTQTLALRGRDRRGLAVLFCDLDGFKGVNDSLGHEAGDELLIALAARLRSELRPGDGIARLGGDEFAVLMEEASGPDDVLAVGRRLLEAVRRPVRIRGREVALGASIGGVLGTGIEDVGELLRCSDVAMYSVKSSGKNDVALFSPEMLVHRIERVQLESDLSHALDRGQLRLHYQPLVCLATGQIEGFEALLRWEHPLRGLLAPGEFIDVAEETGAIEAIGTWVLGQAVTDGVEFCAAASRPLSMAVNVSGRQLGGHLLEQALSEVMGRCGDLSLVLELTESTLVSASTSVAVLERLRGQGVSVAVDDFGTGYSSIAYLRALPVDALKLDRFLVSDSDRDPRAAGVVSAVVQMAESLELDVIAEGLETAEQAAAMRALGCGLGQGYLFSRPVPAAQVPGLLARPVRVIEPAVMGGARLIA